MKKLLHIISAPREDESRTLQISRVFLESFRSSHPDWVVEEIDLFREELPSLAMKGANGRYILLDGKGIFGELREVWDEIIAHIERFMSADAYLVSTPMWNFSIPYALKHYIDILVQPGYLFRYTDKGVEGLAKGRRMVVITSRGGEYVDEGSRSYDFQEPYLRTMFGFVGITDMTFIIAQPMDGVSDESRRERLDEAKTSAREIADKL